MSRRALTAHIGLGRPYALLPVPGSCLGQLCFGEHQGVAFLVRIKARGCCNTCLIRAIAKGTQHPNVAGTLTTGVSTQAGRIAVVGWLVRKQIGRQHVGMQVPDAPCKRCLGHSRLLSAALSQRLTAEPAWDILQADSDSSAWILAWSGQLHQHPGVPGSRNAWSS